MKPNIVICLPARYQSTRLPGKPLLEIAGKPLIIWALESAAKINAKQMIVATDDERIKKLVEVSGYQAIMTSHNHHSGTDRIAEVANMMEWSDDTIVVNYQGDEPMTPKVNIEQLIAALRDNPQASIATLYQAINNYQDLINPNNVKLVSDESDYALYFSRSAIPHSRKHFPLQQLDQNINYKHHIGLYAYRASFLKSFSQLKPTKLEDTESLEQLRAMSHGFRIIAKCAKQTMPHGIDTKEDIIRFEKLLSIQT
ncbi:MAG: 3-deoxy-manno-octulosonate cytidylyltransferase [Alcanivoracaceae bacterium]|nr:3-deoxy-manno-octulosonate cytidylyltransferase [Alcanivoracaceae bacterium]